MSDFDSMVDDNQAAAPAQGAGGPSFDSLQDDGDKYNQPLEQVKAGLEGAFQGVAGPLAPLIEKKYGVREADIRGRAEANPVTHGVGEAAGLVGGAFTGTGEAAVMEGIGKSAQEATGLANLAKDAPYLHRVGSSAVQQAAEMAVLQGSNEASKQILNDPDASAQSALANIGLAAAFGGAGGAFMTGAVSPLWHATAGPKVEALLSGLKDHLNGVSGAPLSEDIAQSANVLGLKLEPEIQAGISTSPSAQQYFSDLRRGENKTVLDSIEKLHKDVSDSVASSLKLNPDSVANYSENEAGHDLHETFSKEYEKLYGPQQKAMELRDAEASPIKIPDDQRLKQYGDILEKGMSESSANSPYFKEYEDYGARLLDAENIGAVDKIKTEINNRIKTPLLDFNTKAALRNIKSSLADFQEAQITRAAAESDKAALANQKVPGLPKVNVGEIESAKPDAQALINRRAETNRSYSEFAKMSDELTNHLGIGDFRGAGSLNTKISQKIAPEDLLKKFSFRGNSDFIPFLQKYLPETYEKVKENELKKLIKPSILQAKGENPINVSKLHQILTKEMAGKADYIKAILPEGAAQKIEAGKNIINAIPSPRDSGTPAGIGKLFARIPATALAAVSFLTGHSLIGGALAGEMASRLGKDAPEAIKLAYLRFLASDTPVQAQGFKAMVDFIHASTKGETLLAKATTNVLKSGAQVLTSSQMPAKSDLDKLDKIVEKTGSNPVSIINAQQGQLGHYLPNHQTAATQASTQAISYLQQLKPKAFQPSPLDKPIQPSTTEQARYYRALTIAQQPAVILQHIKDGTLQTSDMKDLQAMYPAVYKNMADKLSAEITNKQSNEEPIPYKTRVGISLFLGQPLDVSMSPSSIIAAQPKPQPAPGNPPPSKKGSPSKMSSKSSNLYKTPNQAAESDRSSRD